MNRGSRKGGIHAHDKTKGNLEATPAMNSTCEDVNAIQLRPLFTPLIAHIQKLKSQDA